MLELEENPVARKMRTRTDASGNLITIQAPTYAKGIEFLKLSGAIRIVTSTDKAYKKVPNNGGDTALLPVGTLESNDGNEWCAHVVYLTRCSDRLLTCFYRYLEEVTFGCVDGLFLDMKKLTELDVTPESALDTDGYKKVCVLYYSGFSCALSNFRCAYR